MATKRALGARRKANASTAPGGETPMARMPRQSSPAVRVGTTKGTVKYPVGGKSRR